MAHNWQEKQRTTDVEIESNITFDKMMLSDRVLLGLTKNGFTHPSPIQLRAIPLGISGLDILMQAKSGTGKTLVFATIVLESYRKDVKAPQSLIVTPTRELAVQIEQILALLGTESSGFHVSSFIGGMDVANDRKRLQKCKAIVGTPGRIVHLIKNNVLNMSKIRVIVLDEVDKLFSGSFAPDIDFIFKSLPKKRQVIGSSATYDKSVEIAMNVYMKNPIGVTPRKEAPVLLGVKQFIYELDVGENPKQMQEMQHKVKAIVSILSTVPFKQCLIFSNSQQRAESYSNYLANEGWPCDVIMGSQEQSTRLDIFKKFKDFKCRILVATDLMARGIDSENVNLVINVEVPNDHALYLHRIGRCGRFGSHGIAVTLSRNSKELMEFRKLLGSIGGSAMKVLNFPKNVQNNGLSLGDPDVDLTSLGEVCGITATELETGDEILESDRINSNKTADIVRKNMELLDICKRLVDQPENGNIPNEEEEDLFESYSMVVNGSCITSDMDDIPVVATPNNDSVDVNRQFIDAISRLNLYPEEVATPQSNDRQSNFSKDVNESSSDCDNGDLNSNTDGSNLGSDKVSELDSCDDDESDRSCSYAQSDSDDDEDIAYDQCVVSSGNDIEAKWNAQFRHQIALIQNYVSNTRYMMDRCRNMEE
ncbi:hypothetical protein HA402_001911 [Bradysia odoriphaga]|nr:hypothetical protein HA402_001911 [Bradysia odoriphaga]